MLEIVLYPHPALRYESRLVTRIDENLRTVVRQMFDLMYAARGIGLAANQVGLPFRLFVLNITGDPEDKAEELVFINPEILRGEGDFQDEEGCLSFPGLYGKVNRKKKIRVRAMDLSGKIVERDISDLFARAVQHEADHLAGRLFVDHFDASLRDASQPTVSEIEARFRQLQAEGRFPPDDQIREQLDAMVKDNRLEAPAVLPAQGDR